MRLSRPLSSSDAHCSHECRAVRNASILVGLPQSLLVPLPDMAERVFGNVRVGSAPRSVQDGGIKISRD
jgi:hypothetical protein